MTDPRIDRSAGSGDDAEQIAVSSPSTRIAALGIARRTLVGIAAVLIAAVAISAGLRERGVVPAFSADEGIGMQQLVTPAFTGAPRTSARGTRSATRRALSTELGSRVTDYLVLAQAGSAAAKQVAFEIAAALRPIAGGGPAAAQFEALSRVDNVASRGGAVTAAEQLLDVQRFRAGMWVELLRLAAEARSMEVLMRPDIASSLRRISRGTFSAETQNLAQRLSDELKATPPSIDSIHTDAIALLSELSR